MHLFCMMARPLAISEQVSFPVLTMLLPEIIDIAKQFQYLHGATS
jgi:hypothetical protein